MTDDPVAALRDRHRHLAAQITATGFTATGTVLKVRTVCGTPGCACHTDPARRHGPYWQYTRKVNGKTITRRLTSTQAALYTQWISNTRTLRNLLTQMQQVSDQARDIILAAPAQNQPAGANSPKSPSPKRGT